MIFSLIPLVLSRWRLLLIAGAVVGALLTGIHLSQSRAQNATLKAEVTNLKKEIEDTRKIMEGANQRAEVAAVETTQMRDQIDAFKRKLSIPIHTGVGTGTAGCRFGASDADGLRNLARRASRGPTRDARKH